MPAAQSQDNDIRKFEEIGTHPAAMHNGIYQALEFLETLQLAHRIPSLNAYVACDSASADHTAAFMICDCCGGTQEFQPKLDKTALNAASEQDFAIKSMALEVRGLCHACRQAA